MSWVGKERERETVVGKERDLKFLQGWSKDFPKTNIYKKELWNFPSYFMVMYLFYTVQYQNLIGISIIVNDFNEIHWNKPTNKLLITKIH